MLLEKSPGHDPGRMCYGTVVLIGHVVELHAGWELQLERFREPLD